MIGLWDAALQEEELLLTLKLIIFLQQYTL